MAVQQGMEDEQLPWAASAIPGARWATSYASIKVCVSLEPEALYSDQRYGPIVFSIILERRITRWRSIGTVPSRLLWRCGIW